LIRPAPVHRSRVAGLLLAALGCVFATAAPAGEPGPVRDLYYGDALFHFYQDDHFTALTRLLVARSAGRVPHHEAEAELLLGGLYLHYGQHLRAEQIFTGLLDSQAGPDVRDRAWFYLGKLRYQRGFYPEALEAFARVTGELPPELASQRPMLVAQSHLALGQFDQAVALLEGWQGPETWSAYARYNLGVALVRLGRLEEGARQLDRVGRDPAPTAERRDLRDKANLALGYAYLQQSLDGAAEPVLARVRLKGPFSTKALLGMGWSRAAQGRFEAALTPWLELEDRDLLDSAVQESLLAIPYAYGHLAAHGEAAARYEGALAAFDAEIHRLDEAIDRARQGGLVPAVLKADDPDIGRWFWELREIGDGVESRYLYHLIADHHFQEGLRNVRDLMALEQHLADWTDKLGAFADMVDTRREAHVRRAPEFAAGLEAVDLDRLRQRREELAGHLAAIEAGRDVAGLGTAEEQDQWQRLTALEEDPGFAGADPELRARHRLLKGVLLWNLDRDYKLRLWQSRRQLTELDRVLARADGRQGRTLASGAGVPGELDGFAARIEAARPRIEALRARLARARGLQERQLTAMAVAALQDQRERLAAYRVQAQFALATIHDRAATAARAMPVKPAVPGEGTP
jgi:tetratricopeptide (TPR) repeat protein